MARSGTSSRTSKRAAPRTRAATKARTASARKTTARQASAAQQRVSGAAQDAEQRASSTLRQQLDERSGQFADQLEGTAGDVRQIAGQLRDQDNDAAARLADMAAQRIEQAANYLSNKDADALLADLEGLARSRPWLTAGAAAATGFLATRALTASRRKQQGGGMVNLDAGRGFDESDAEADMAESAGRRR